MILEFVVYPSNTKRDLTINLYGNNKKGFEQCEKELDFKKYSNVSIWPNKRLFEEGESMTIQCEHKVMIDVNDLPTFKYIRIYGELHISEDLMVNVLKAGTIEIGKYGALYVGSKLQHFSQTFTLNAERIMNYGMLSLYGAKSAHRYSLMGQKVID